jgi:hypothetical protein
MRITDVAKRQNTFEINWSSMESSIALLKEQNE